MASKLRLTLTVERIGARPSSGSRGWDVIEITI